MPEYAPGWTTTERYVWDCAVKGEIADLNERDGRTCDPGDPDDWPTERDVSSSFIETILTERAYREAIHPRGVRIVGARFPGVVDLRNRTILFPLLFVRSRMEELWTMNYGAFEAPVWFDGSAFVKPFYAERGNFTSSLYLRKGARFADVRLVGATIGGQLALSNATVTGRLDMEGITVESDLQAHFLTLRGPWVAPGCELARTSI